MKCYTVSQKRVHEGIEIVDPERGLILGERGNRPAWEERLSLFRSNPAGVVNGVVYFAHPIQPRGCEFFTLALPDRRYDHRVLVRLNCRGTGNVTRGKWRTIKGRAALVGNEGRDAEGNLDVLVVLEPGTVVETVFPDGSKNQSESTQSGGLRPWNGEEEPTQVETPAPRPEGLTRMPEFVPPTPTKPVAVVEPEKPKAKAKSKGKKAEKAEMGKLPKSTKGNGKAKQRMKRELADAEV